MFVPYFRVLTQNCQFVFTYFCAITVEAHWLSRVPLEAELSCTSVGHDEFRADMYFVKNLCSNVVFFP